MWRVTGCENSSINTRWRKLLLNVSLRYSDRSVVGLGLLLLLLAEFHSVLLFMFLRFSCLGNIHRYSQWRSAYMRKICESKHRYSHSNRHIDTDIITHFSSPTTRRGFRRFQRLFALQLMMVLSHGQWHVWRCTSVSQLPCQINDAQDFLRERSFACITLSVCLCEWVWSVGECLQG